MHKVEPTEKNPLISLICELSAFKRKPALLSGIYFEIYLNNKLFKTEISLDKLDPAFSMLLSTYQLSVPTKSSALLFLGSFIPLFQVLFSPISL